MRVIVTGSRDCIDQLSVSTALDRFHASYGPITCLIEGGQRKYDIKSRNVIGGVDFWASEWAKALGIPLITEEARWATFGRTAGPIRNGMMIRLHAPDAVLRFPGGYGTADMARQAKIARLPVYRIASEFIKPPSEAQKMAGKAR